MFPFSVLSFLPPIPPWLAFTAAATLFTWMCEKFQEITQRFGN